MAERRIAVLGAGANGASVGAGPTAAAGLDGSEAADDRAAEVAELLAHSGAVEVVDDVRSAKWMKLVSNCTTLVRTAILGEPMLARCRRARLSAAL